MEKTTIIRQEENQPAGIFGEEIDEQVGAQGGGLLEFYKFIRRLILDILKQTLNPHMAPKFIR